MRSKKFKAPLYGTDFEVVLYKGESEIEKYFEEQGYTVDFKNYDGGLFVNDKTEDIALVLCEEKEGYPTPGIISHEAKHLVNQIYTLIGCELDKYNDEPECYLLGWIVNRIHEFVNENK